MNVLVVDGPVSASGLPWYQVAPIELPRAFVGAPFGWVASGQGGVPWLETGLVVCPAAPRTSEELGQVSPYVLLSCFGDRPITIRAKIGQSPPPPCGFDRVWKITPDWLGSECPDRDFRVFIENEPDYFQWVVFGPEVDRAAVKPGPFPGRYPADFPEVDLTGHFDDAAATTCKGVTLDPEHLVPVSPDEIVLTCRTRFVVSSLLPVG